MANFFAKKDQVSSVASTEASVSITAKIGVSFPVVFVDDNGNEFTRSWSLRPFAGDAELLWESDVEMFDGATITITNSDGESMTSTLKRWSIEEKRARQAARTISFSRAKKV